MTPMIDRLRVHVDFYCNWLLSRVVPPLPHYNARLQFPNYPLHGKTRMMGLSEGSKDFKVGLVTYTYYRCVNVLSGIVSGVACVKSSE